MAARLKLLRLTVPCTAVMLLTACGGGSSASPPSVTSYTLSATAGTGGSISPASASVDAGETTSFVITPYSGYVIDGVTGCGGTLTGSMYTTGAINANCTVTASFMSHYSVTATAGSGGTISPSSAMVIPGDTATFTVTPDSGYVITGVTGCGGNVTGTTYTTGPVDGNCTATASFAAAFTWVGGSDGTDATGIYGTQGVAAATNVPGARDAGVTWTDASGDLWMFGGFAGYQNSVNPATGNFLNDLWEYSPASGEWTWVGGSNGVCAQSVYGTQGIAAAANVPGARSGAISWMDGNGNMWLFGGGGCGLTDNFVLYNDLWKYSPVSGEWTWVGGSTTPYASGVYGNEGVPAPSNMPGARAGPATWTDANGNVWMFGGFTYDTSTSKNHHLNDLWEYSPSSNEWTWIGGANTFDADGVYGTQGVAAAANVPGARNGSLFWTDAHGNFWLFGGVGYDSSGNFGELDDLWEHSPSTGEWTWVNGSKAANPTGVYGIQGVAAAVNVPPPRDGAATWMDGSGNLWLFGGEGYDAATGWYHRLNDLWEYSPSSGEWTWVTGSLVFDATGVYGSEGFAAAANVPGARAVPFTWKDLSGNVWLFGGYQYDDPSGTRFEMNDLWKYPAN
ncbi:MAG TPA: kelch repeat-containing protein [Steroidobacteraceae bacterium]|nr:kelch repeat-containing protein [Steroidobacteraceae bacterium]